LPKFMCMHVSKINVNYARKKAFVKNSFKIKTISFLDKLSGL
jgi:hypothetical protein